MPNELKLEFKLNDRIIDNYTANKCISLIVKAEYDLKYSKITHLKAYGVTPDKTNIELGEPCPMPCDDDTSGNETTKSTETSLTTEEAIS